MTDPLMIEPAGTDRSATSPARTCVVIVNYNGGEFLGASVRQVLECAEQPDVVVVDNGSVDGSIEGLGPLRQSPALRVLELGENRGFGAAVNAGAQDCQSTYLMLLNPDCFVRNDTLSGLVEYLQQDSEAAMAGPVVFDTNGVEQRGGRRHEPTPARALARSFGRSARTDGARSGYDLNSMPLPGAPEAVDAISGSCLVIRRERFESVGAMDESFFLHCEDLDLCRRVRDAGHKVMFVPAHSVIHVQGASGRNVKVERYKHRSMVRYFDKHFADETPLWQSLLLKAGVWARFAAVVVKGRLKPVHERSTAEELDRIQTLLERVPGDSVVVTGATSFLAEPVMRALREQGREVIAVSRSVPQSLPAGSRWLSYDYFTKVSAADFGSVAAMVHLAPLWVLPDCIHARRGGASMRVVAVGSSSVRTKRDSANASEQKIARKLETAESAAREIAAAGGHCLAVIHPTMIYDPSARDQNVGRLTRFARRFRMLPLVSPSSGLRQPIHADDLGALCVAVLDQAANGEQLFVGGGETLRYEEMMERISQASSARLVKVPQGVFRRALEIAGRLPFGPDLNGSMVDRFQQDLCFANDTARDRYGFSPRQFMPPDSSQKGASVNATGVR